MASTEDSVYDSVKSVLYGPSLTDWGGDKPSKNNETGTTSDVRSQITVGSRRLEKTLESTRRRIAPENNQNLMRGRSSPSTQEVTAWTVEVLQEIDELTIPSSSLSVSDMLKGKATYVHVHNEWARHV